MKFKIGALKVVIDDDFVEDMIDKGIDVVTETTEAVLKALREADEKK